MSPFVLVTTTVSLLFLGIRGEEKRLLIDESQSVQEQVRMLSEEVLVLKSSLEAMQQSGSGGSMYIRWGRSVCPSEADLVYKGYVGGSHYTHSGGAANWLCLPENPEWGYYEEGVASGAKVYGGEYEFRDFHTGGGSKFFGKNLNDQDAPCVVCSVPQSRSIMIPARLNCPDESWGKQFSIATGYLVAGDYQHASATEYICLDSDAQMLAGGASNMDGRTIYLAEAICGSLNCPPYINGRELTCVVCSK